MFVFINFMIRITFVFLFAFWRRPHLRSMRTFKKPRIITIINIKFGDPIPFFFFRCAFFFLFASFFWKINDGNFLGKRLINNRIQFNAFRLRENFYDFEFCLCVSCVFFIIILFSFSYSFIFERKDEKVYKQNNNEIQAKSRKEFKEQRSKTKIV